MVRDHHSHFAEEARHRSAKRTQLRMKGERKKRQGERRNGRRRGRKPSEEKYEEEDGGEATEKEAAEDSRRCGELGLVLLPG